MSRTRKRNRVRIDRKARMQLPPVHAQVRPPQERVKDFKEIYIPYSPEDAQLEAARCLHCPNAPCQAACPLHNDIPRALGLIEAGKFVEAAQVYRETSTMPEICGRVCPQTLCEEACVLNKAGKPIDTRHLEAFAADAQRRATGVPLPQIAPATGKRVAVIGAGPAGLTVAESLTRAGHQVVVFDKCPDAGGLLKYGIPNFKLDKSLVDKKTQWLKQLGISFRFGVTVGRDVTLQSLRAEYDVLFIGIGTSKVMLPHYEGDDLEGVYCATEFLTLGKYTCDRQPQDNAHFAPGPRVHVLGGGDTAMDCLRTAVRLPGVTEATCYYRRSEAEMPAHKQDYHYALEEGATFQWLTNPVRFIGDENGKLKAVEYQKMQLGEPDASGRRRPIPIPESNFIVEAETVVLALGYRPDWEFNEHADELKVDPKGRIAVDDPHTGHTNLPGVFAAGDVVFGANLVSPAIAAALDVAQAMDAYLKG